MNYSSSHFNSSPQLTSGMPQNIMPGTSPGSQTPGTDFGRLLLAKQIERTADYIASIGGYMAGYPTGFAFGVFTKTNPLATAAIGGSIGATIFPRIIKEVVT